MFRFLIIAQEPAPYKTDLFNAFTKIVGWETTVFHVCSKDWSPEGSHNFVDLPAVDYRQITCKEKGWIGEFVNITRMARLFFQKIDLLMICGYNKPSLVCGIFLAIILRIPLVFWADHFNCRIPRIGGIFITPLRSLMRKIIFRYASAVLVCGQANCKSAVEAGCLESKALNFPYVVDEDRIKKPEKISKDVNDMLELKKDKKFILFSGRLIERKGLGVLLQAVENLQQHNNKFFLIIEGDGPLREMYKKQAKELGLSDIARFLGFRQMHDHSFLLSIADVIVVPSSEDPWGIVVHEGMLSGKVVCASDFVGSAIDRIESGKNGFLFRSGDWQTLSKTLNVLLSDDTLRQRIGKAAESTASKWSTERNVKLLANVVNCL